MKLASLANNNVAVSSNLGRDKFFKGATLALAAMRLEMPFETAYATHPYALLLASLNKCRLKSSDAKDSFLGNEML